MCLWVKLVPAQSVRVAGDEARELEDIWSWTFSLTELGTS